MLQMAYDPKSFKELVRYNYNRDLANIYQVIFEKGADMLQKERWSAANRVMKQFNLSPDEQLKAWNVLIAFLAGAARVDSKENDNMRKVLTEAGWFELDEVLHVVVFAAIGQITTGMIYRAITETSTKDTAEAIQAGPLGRQAAHLAEYARRPYLLRKLSSCWWETRRWFKSLVGERE